MKLFDYLKHSKAELQKVVWPSGKQTRDHALMVIAISVGVAAFIGLVDLIIEQLIIKPFLG